MLCCQVSVFFGQGSNKGVVWVALNERQGFNGAGHTDVIEAAFF